MSNKLSAISFQRLASIFTFRLRWRSELCTFGQREVNVNV